MTESTEMKFKSLLTGAKLKCTKARTELLARLQSRHRPQSAEDICSAMGRNAPNRATVYRTLEILADKGIIHRAYTDQRKTFYELADHCSKTQCHPHFTCINCGRTSCLLNTSLPLTKEIGNGYQVTKQKVRFEGLCPLCASS